MNYCPYCFHSSFTGPFMDDLEANCGCECHFTFDDEDDED